MSPTCPIPVSEVALSAQVAGDLFQVLGTVPDPRPGGGASAGVRAWRHGGRLRVCGVRVLRRCGAVVGGRLG